MPHWLKTNLGLIFFFSTNVGTPDYCRYHQITVGSHHMTASSHHFRDHQNISHPNLTCLYLKRYQSLISSPIVSYFSLREISLSFFFFFFFHLHLCISDLPAYKPPGARNYYSYSSLHFPGFLCTVPSNNFSKTK